MKEILISFSAYHAWANQLLLDYINSLPEEKQTQEVTSSFNSLYKTVLHMWDAESIWWQRMKLQERIQVPSSQFTGNMKELSAGLLQQDKLWLEWVSGSQEHMLRHVVQYQNSKKEQFKQPVFQIMMQVFNHATYHRGQLVTMLRELGVDKIPATDFILWSRKKQG